MVSKKSAASAAAAGAVGYIAKSAFNRMSGYALNRGEAEIKKLANQVSKAIVQQFKQPKSKPQTTQRPKQMMSQTTKTKYRTTGTLRGKLPTQFKKQTDEFKSRGVVMRQESGGVITDSQCIYIGHSTCPQNLVIRNVCRALLKTLVRKCGQTISSFEVQPESGYMYATLDHRDPAALTDWTQKIQALSGTFDNMASLIQNLLFTAQVTATPQEFGRLAIYHSPYSTGTYQKADAEIDLRQYKLFFDIKSVLKVQNETLASATEGDPNADEIDNITNNPLTGMIYSNLGKWANYLTYRDGKFKTSSSVSPLGPELVANRQNGVLSATSTSSSTSELKKPPLRAYQFGCKRQGLVNLEPGAIKYSNLHFTASMYFNTWAMKFTDPNWSQAEDYKIAFGNCALIGLEKSLASRQVGASTIKVGYQIDNTFKVYGSSVQPPQTNEIIEVL